jgi:hypothetical protein
MDAVLRKRLEIAFALLMLGIFAIFYIVGLSYPPRPRELPVIVNLVGMLFLVIHLINVIRRPAVPGKKTGTAWNWGIVLKSIGGMVLYMAVTYLIGMVLASGVLVYAELWAFGQKNKRNMVITSVATVVVVYLLFQVLLGAPMYTGKLWGG